MRIGDSTYKLIANRINHDDLGWIGMYNGKSDPIFRSPSNTRTSVLLWQWQWRLNFGIMIMMIDIVAMLCFYISSIISILCFFVGLRQYYSHGGTYLRNERGWKCTNCTLIDSFEFFSLCGQTLLSTSKCRSKRTHDSVSFGFHIRLGFFLLVLVGKV